MDIQKLRLQACLVAILLFAGCLFANAEAVNIDGISYEFDDDNKTAVIIQVDFSGDVVLPETVAYLGNVYTVTTIGNGGWVFEHSGPVSVTIPSTVTAIADYAFYACRGLTSIDIPSNVETIGKQAFEDCSGLTTATIAAKSIGEYAFVGCSALKSVTLCEGIESIGRYAFHNCEGISDVVIPSSIKTMGQRVFMDCKGLVSVTIAPGALTFGEGAFTRCSNLVSVSIQSSVTAIDAYAFQNCGSLASINIPYGVVVVGASAFSGCGNLVSVNIPSSVTTIGSSVFSRCSSLASVSIPSSVMTIGRWAFYGCQGMTSVTIPSSVTTIDEGTFECCGSLGDVYLDGDDMKETASDAFSEIASYATLHVNAALVETYQSEENWAAQFSSIVTLPDDVVADGATYHVDAESGSTVTLTTPAAATGSVALPEIIKAADGTEYAVTAIGEKAFENCAALTSVSLPAGIVQIGSLAFSGCTSLTDVYCYGDAVKEAQSDAFGTLGSSVSGVRAMAADGIASATLHVPSALVETYRHTAPWSGFGRVVALEDDVNGIKPVGADAAKPYRIFTIDGRELPAMQKGLNIVRTNDGQSVKVIK